jgi:inosine-uridine nucleoside N-ribohydrolase
MHVHIDCVSAKTLGKTVCQDGSETRAPNVLVTEAMDVPWFWQEMLAALVRADAHISSIKSQ